MDAENLLPLRQPHLIDHGGASDPGRIHQSIDASEPRGGLFDEPLDEIGVRDIAGACKNAIPRKGGPSGFESVSVHVGEDQVRAETGRKLGDAEADALARARDENRPPGERHRIVAVHFDTLSQLSIPYEAVLAGPLALSL
jgi:hypothetical protein